MRDNEGNDQDRMTLRDRFAMAALTGMLSNQRCSDNTPVIAECAYEYADATLAERAKTPTRTAELAALREQVAKARLEGAREAWRIFVDGYAIVDCDKHGATDPYLDMDAARAAYLAAFGEEAPQ